MKPSGQTLNTPSHITVVVVVVIVFVVDYMMMMYELTQHQNCFHTAEHLGDQGGSSGFLP